MLKKQPYQLSGSSFSHLVIRPAFQKHLLPPHLIYFLSDFVPAKIMSFPENMMFINKLFSVHGDVDLLDIYGYNLDSTTML